MLYYCYYSTARVLLLTPPQLQPPPRRPKDTPETPQFNPQPPPFPPQITSHSTLPLPPKRIPKPRSHPATTHRPIHTIHPPPSRPPSTPPPVPSHQAPQVHISTDASPAAIQVIDAPHSSTHVCPRNASQQLLIPRENPIYQRPALHWDAANPLNQKENYCYYLAAVNTSIAERDREIQLGITPTDPPAIYLLIESLTRKVHKPASALPIALLSSNPSPEKVKNQKRKSDQVKD